MGKEKACSEEVDHGARGINFLRDADEEAVDDVEEEVEEEVQHDENSELVDADARESEVEEGMEQRKAFRLGGKGKLIPCDQPDCIKKFTQASTLNRHIKVVHKKIKPFMLDVKFLVSSH